MAEAVFHVPTAFCSHCKYTIEQAVGALASVTRVVVDLPNRAVAVTYDPAALELEAIRQRLEGAGFPARAV